MVRGGLDPTPYPHALKRACLPFHLSHITFFAFCVLSGQKLIHYSNSSPFVNTKILFIIKNIISYNQGQMTSQSERSAYLVSHNHHKLRFKLAATGRAEKPTQPYPSCADSKLFCLRAFAQYNLLRYSSHRFLYRLIFVNDAQIIIKKNRQSLTLIPAPVSATVRRQYHRFFR
jgi:hypothetical protein